ncbi:MAG: hypothetical protein EPN93_08525 [Spirochaetes bacterium]|nr:MAG: hypothetical protein EPN93_08525 [Spirochaetota bacterium]
MADTSTLMRYCASLRFGSIEPCGAERALLVELNDTVLALLRSLPESQHAPASLFLMEYSGLKLGGPIDFFRNYHAPAWSVLHWIAARADNPRKPDSSLFPRLARGHAMAMLLHSLDDHLNDGEIPSTHLALLVRSEAWRVMRDSFSIAERPDALGSGIADSCIDAYYRAISSPPDRAGLDAYCTHFRGQMATWLAGPLLAARAVSDDPDFYRGVRESYESFGIAWRLLDDIQDVAADARAGGHSAVYHALDEEGRALWDGLSMRPPVKEAEIPAELVRALAAQDICSAITNRICAELARAESIAARHAMQGLADEFRVLAAPLAQEKSTGYERI